MNEICSVVYAVLRTSDGKEVCSCEVSPNADGAYSIHHFFLSDMHIGDTLTLEWRDFKHNEEIRRST